MNLVGMYSVIHATTFNTVAACILFSQPFFKSNFVLIDSPNLLKISLGLFNYADISESQPYFRTEPRIGIFHYILLVYRPNIMMSQWHN